MAKNDGSVEEFLEGLGFVVCPVEECELREEWRVMREDACAEKLLGEHSRRRDAVGGEGSDKGDRVTAIFTAGAEALLRAHHGRGIGADQVRRRFPSSRAQTIPLFLCSSFSSRATLTH